jgi:hypothetical protein
MWILHFLPDSFLIWVVNIILIVGAIGTFLSFFVINRLMRWYPPLAHFHTLFQILSVAILIAGVYFKGGYSTEMEWREKVAIEQQKVAEAEQKAETATGKVRIKVVEKVKRVKDVQIVVQEKIKEVEKRIDSECKLDPEVPKLLNEAAKSVGDRK